MRVSAAASSAGGGQMLTPEKGGGRSGGKPWDRERKIATAQHKWTDEAEKAKAPHLSDQSPPSQLAGGYLLEARVGCSRWELGLLLQSACGCKVGPSGDGQGVCLPLPSDFRFLISWRSPLRQRSARLQVIDCGRLGARLVELHTVAC